MLDLQGRRLEFGKQDGNGTRTRFGRMAISTSLGDLVLDSGADRLILFGIEPDESYGGKSFTQTLTGAQRVGLASRKLIVEGRIVWHGDAIVMPGRTEPGVAGLLPPRLFKAIYVCNSEGYVAFE